MKLTHNRPTAAIRDLVICKHTLTFYFFKIYFNVILLSIKELGDKIGIVSRVRFGSSEVLIRGGKRYLLFSKRSRKALQPAA
jgi:hypothetical protein